MTSFLPAQDDGLFLLENPAAAGSGTPEHGAASSGEVNPLGAPNVVTARFVNIPVVGIDRCDLFCDYFEPDAPMVRIGEREMQPVGLIKSVAAQIVFRSPVHIDPRCLIAKTPRFTSLTTRETRVELGIMDTTGEISQSSTGNAVDLHQFFAGSDNYQYSVRVPLIHCRLVRPEQMPPVDRIETKDHHVLHYTITIPGVVWPSMRRTEYYIRIKVIQTLPLAEVISISSSILDSQRIEEACSNFCDWVAAGCRRLTSSCRSADSVPSPAVPEALPQHDCTLDPVSSHTPPPDYRSLPPNTLFEGTPPAEAYSMPPPIPYGVPYMSPQQPIFPTQPHSPPNYFPS